MLIKTGGIVFRTKKYSETSVIADIFTEEKGLQSYIVSGVRTQKAKVSAGLLQIMSLVELVAYHRDDHELHRIKEIKTLFPYRSIPFDLRKGAVGMFMMEIARKTIREHESHPELFRFLLENFIFLDGTTTGFFNLHLHFMLALTEFLGFTPGGEYGVETPYFDLEEGIFMEVQPPHNHWLRPELGKKLSLFLQLPHERCHEIALTREERKTLLKTLLDFYRLHIEHFPVIHSHSVLEEVMAG